MKRSLLLARLGVLAAVLLSASGCYLFTLETPCASDENCEPGTYCDHSGAEGLCREGTGPDDAGPPDAGPPADGGAVDSGPLDSGPLDSGPFDSGPDDSGPDDSGPVDSGPLDSGPVLPDAGVDAGALGSDAGGPGADSGVTVCAAVGTACDPAMQQPADFVCEGEGDRFFCLATCAFSSYEERACETGGACMPSERDSGVLLGVCRTSAGLLGYASSCSGVDDCATGLSCVQSPIHGGSFCLTLCDPLAATPETGACAAGQGDCAEIVSTDFGACDMDCIPFSDTGVCGETEWCAPVESPDAPVGSCTEKASPLPGVACATNEECGEGQGCVGDCRRVCSLSVDDNEPFELGGCGGGNWACLPRVYLGPDEQPLPSTWLGHCYPSCDFDLAIPCDDANLSCVPGEILDQPSDGCLSLPSFTEGEPCFEPGMLCSSMSACLDSGSGLVCHGLCRDNMGGGFGTTAHPDCALPGSVCTDVGYGVFGLCQ